MTQLLDHLSENLERIRRDHNLNQNELSHRCGFDTSYIGKIERGSKSPSLSAIQTIADHLDVRAHQLLNPDFNESSNGSRGSDES
jgi:transcriptional regulator with XRE-family HTH domain